MTFAAFLFRLLMAFVLGAAIGLERQWRQRIAGVRTNALVSVGACMFVFSSVLTEGDGSPTRVAAQVVSGIGFLGAGVIIRDGLNIRGLNTAATLWCSAGVGVLSGMGYVLQALLGAFCVLVANLLIRPLVRRVVPTPLPDQDTTSRYLVRVACRTEAEARVRSTLLSEAMRLNLRLRSIQSEDAENALRVEVWADLLAAGSDASGVETLVARLSFDEAVSAVRWELAAQSVDEPQALLESLAEERAGRLS